MSAPDGTLLCGISVDDPHTWAPEISVDRVPRLSRNHRKCRRKIRKMPRRRNTWKLANPFAMSSLLSFSDTTYKIVITYMYMICTRYPLRGGYKVLTTDEITSSKTISKIIYDHDSKKGKAISQERSVPSRWSACSGI